VGHLVNQPTAAHKPAWREWSCYILWPCYVNVQCPRTKCRFGRPRYTQLLTMPLPSYQCLLFAPVQRKFCFEAESWARCVHECCFLSKVFRQASTCFHLHHTCQASLHTGPWCPAGLLASAALCCLEQLRRHTQKEGFWGSHLSSSVVLMHRHYRPPPMFNCPAGRPRVCGAAGPHPLGRPPS